MPDPLIVSTIQDTIEKERGKEKSRKSIFLTKVRQNQKSWTNPHEADAFAQEQVLVWHGTIRYSLM